MLKIYHNPRCSKSRETLQLIQEKKMEVEIVEYLKKPLTHDEIHSLITALNLPIESLIRKSEKIYKTNFKGKVFTEAEWIKIIIDFPSLLERPIVINEDGKAILGRPPQNVNQLL